MTDNAVRDLYPEGANDILGYGVNLPAGVDKSASLIDSFLPYVISSEVLTHWTMTSCRATFTNAVCGVELNHMDGTVF
jgi:hypothetical protein